MHLLLILLNLAPAPEQLRIPNLTFVLKQLQEKMKKYESTGTEEEEEHDYHFKGRFNERVQPANVRHRHH